MQRGVKVDKKIVIIGGTACGPKAAARARRCDQQAQVTMVEQGENLSVATCGLPYYVSGVINSRRELLTRGPDFFKAVMNIDVLTRTRAVAIDRKNHRVEVLNLKTDRASNIEYDKLVLATGSTPAVPDLKGKNLSGIFTLSKIEEAHAIRNLVSPRKIKKAVIIGAGLIGLEMAEALVSRGLEVSVVEALDRVLPALLDFEMAAYVEKHLREKGVKLLLGQSLTGFDGDKEGRLIRVITEKAELEADLALLAIGVRPNTGLAKSAGLDIGATGGIAVNSHLQTSDPDIYAGGDCVENVHLVTGRKILAPLGSTANKHGRVIGTNVAGGDEAFPGVLGTSIAKVFEYNVGRVGLSQSQAQAAGYDVVTSLVPGYEHATYYPKGKEILVKLVAEKSNGKLLGGQVVGPGETAKRIDVLATALSFSATVDDLANTDLAYAPPYNSALDPLHNAANVIRNKQSGLARALNPMEVESKLKRGDDFIFLDVRSPGEWAAYRIEAPQARLLPLSELRQNLDKLPGDAEIVIFCHTSVRAYQAQRILDGAGFKDVKFMDGSIASWPYELSTERKTPAGE
ncbi:MAG: FAD-dependent oxidoreductase [Deltaproteobacteria bacterium]|nr:FAD-dependent oxidoreductase [Deltaproteobacteria bacterium]